MVKDLNKIARKGANKRCPFRKQCGKVCEHVGSELDCDYYKWNACGDDIIEDQERIREIMEKTKIREKEEAILAEMEDSEAGGLVMIPVDKLYPHPDNPRKNLGDLKELSESIKVKGVMQNLTVVPRADEDGTYTIIIGHRRHAAAMKAGLKELPCVIVEMSEQDQLATMLLENIQRSDLTAYEQAKGFQMMMDFGDSVSGIVKKTGFSESTVRRRLKMAELDEEVLKKVSGRQISFGDIDKLQEIEDLETRNKVLADIGTANFNNSLKTELDKQKLAKTVNRMKEAFKSAGLYEIPGNEYSKHSYQYCISGEKLLNEEIERAKSRGAVGYYYSYRDTFYMMSKKGETPKAEKSEAELKREKAERERNQRYAELGAAFKRAYELRLEFIDKYTFSNARANISEIMAFLVCMGLNDEINYTLPREDLNKLVCGGEPLGNSYEEIRDSIENIESGKWLLVTAWLLCDSEVLDCNDYYGRYEENENLNLIYEFLESIGYEMSDEERELLDGSSELYMEE